MYPSATRGSAVFSVFYFSLLLWWTLRGVFQSIINDLRTILLLFKNSMGTATEQQRCRAKQQLTGG